MQKKKKKERKKIVPQEAVLDLFVSRMNELITNKICHLTWLSVYISHLRVGGSDEPLHRVKIVTEVG